MPQEYRTFLAESDVVEPCLIEPSVLPYGGKCVLFGPPGIGKSLLVTQLAFDVTNGLPWLGTFPTGQGKVVYLQCELPRGKFRDRLRVVAAQYPRTPPESLYVSTSLTMRAAPGDAEFASLLRELRTIRPILLILDPQYKLYTGDENDGTDMARFYQILDTMIGEIECAIMLVSHSRKRRFDGDGQAIDMGGQELKGTSRQQDWPDAEIRIMGHSNMATVQFEKMRYGETPEPFKVALDEKTLTFHPIVTEGASSKAVAQVMALLDAGPMLRVELMNRLLERGVSESTVKRALEGLEAEKAIVVLPVEGNKSMKLIRRIR